MARLVTDAAGRLLEVVSDHDPREMTVRMATSDRTRLTGRSRPSRPRARFRVREAVSSSRDRLGLGLVGDGVRGSLCSLDSGPYAPTV